MSKFLKVLTGVVIVVLVLLAGAELAARWYIGKEMSNELRSDAAAAGSELTEDPKVSFGTSSILLSLVTGNIGQMDLSVPDTLRIDRPDGDNGTPIVAGQPATEIEMRDLDVTDAANPIVGSMRLTSVLPEDYLLATIQAQMAEQNAGTAGDDFASQIFSSLIRITDVTANPDAGTLDVEFTGGAAVLSLRPVVSDDGMAFEVTNGQLLGMDLPAGASQMITEALRSGVTDEASSSLSNVNVDAFEVVDGGVRIELGGTDLPLSELAKATERGVAL